MVSEAEPVPEEPSVQSLCELAGELGVHVCAGIAEVDRGIHYNTQFIVGPEGYVGKQRKVHLSSDEYFFFRGGTDLPVFDLSTVSVGVIICYDNLLPEVSRCLAVKGAELLICPHAARFGRRRSASGLSAWGEWPRTLVKRREAARSVKEDWRLVHACRAYDNGCYAALCNAVGPGARNLRGVEANHAGGCMVFDPNGVLVAQSRSRDIKEEMLLVPLKAKAVVERRHGPCFNLQTRRPEVFSVLTRPTA